jgi:S-formylglutathione hydrolase FrmB
MRKPLRICASVLIVLLTVAGVWSAAGHAHSQPGPLRCRVTLDKDLAPSGASGRLILFMSSTPGDQDVLDVGFVPGAVWVAAAELEYLGPGQSVSFDPDLRAYPHPFSEAPAGAYGLMALLDTNHTYGYSGRGEGDLYSKVVKVENLNPAAADPVDLVIERKSPSRPRPTDTDTVKLAEFQSPLLSKFWGRPITMRAGVVLPADYAKSSTRYPAVYHVHGFGGNHMSAWSQGPALVTAMSEGKQAKMVHVFLDGSFPTGHHEFADSVNNGPWGRALTEEYIPHLEKRFRLIARSYARFLTGHSSGGWSTLWLQVTYPDFFGGTWSTAPDPVDLRSFTGINVTPGSTDNAYVNAEGKPRNLVRMKGKELASIEQFARMEYVLGDYGGQFASFEWVWSPKGKDGRPMQLFNRATGKLDPEVENAWQKYDIRLILEKNWASLAPKLRGKINIICGDADTFHLNEAVVLLKEFLKAKRSDAVVELVPGRDHGDLYKPYDTYPEGLAARIAKEMQAKFQSSSVKAKR